VQRGTERLARYLPSLAAGAGRAEVPVSKTRVAAQLGMKMETLSRRLRQLAAEGVIDVGRREISILDAVVLDRIASSAGNGEK
jgi:CRP-like cAMP-binding protein